MASSFSPLSDSVPIFGALERNTKTLVHADVISAIPLEME